MEPGKLNLQQMIQLLLKVNAKSETQIFMPVKWIQCDFPGLDNAMRMVIAQVCYNHLLVSSMMNDLNLKSLHSKDPVSTGIFLDCRCPIIYYNFHGISCISMK